MEYNATMKAGLTFGYNQRPAGTSAIMHTNTYGYVFDPIGHQKSAKPKRLVVPVNRDFEAVNIVYGDNGSYWREVELFPDGVRAVEVRLQLGGVTPDIRVELSVFVSGVTFEDGSLVRTILTV